MGGVGCDVVPGVEFEGVGGGFVEVAGAELEGGGAFLVGERVVGEMRG